MIGVTIGIGDGWRQVAERAAAQMQRMTGLECHVIDEFKVQGSKFKVAHPSWLKCFVAEIFPGHSEYLVFDADVWAVRPWEPALLFGMMGRRVCAVPEENTPPVLWECARYRMPAIDWYVNGGLVMFGREHAEVWKTVWGLHPKYGTWLEQTALNEAFLRTGAEVVRLPRIYNAMLHGGGLPRRSDGSIAEADLMNRLGFMPKDAVNVHADSIGDAAQVGRFQEALKTE